MLAKRFEHILHDLGMAGLEHPLFYHAPVGIRFKIGGEEPIYLDRRAAKLKTNPAYVQGALDRAAAIYRALPAVPDLLRDSLAQITRDHSLVEEMVARGKMERDSESYRNQKNIITRAVGIGKRVEADFFEVPLLESDCVLLCSDGLTNMVDDAEISRVLKTTDTLKEKTDALIDEANRNGGKDNIAIVLVEPQISEVNV